MADPVNDPGSPAQKPGWQTSEFWLALIPVILGAVLSSGVIAEGTAPARIIGAVLTVLGALGYTAGRAFVKASGNKTAAAVEVAKVSAQALQNPQ